MMMRPVLAFSPAAAAAALLFAFLFAGEPRASAAADTIKLEALLIWGTNDSKSPDPKHKPVEASVRRKLNGLPLKWSNYFEVNRKVFEVAIGGSKREELSKKCSVEIKSSGRGSKVEVFLYGEGEQVVRQSQELPKGEALVVGGNAPNATAWLVLIKRIE